MKVIWEPEDIAPGVVIGQKGRKERWIIGYDPTGATGANFAIINLADGAIARKDQMPETLAKFINTTGDVPLALLNGGLNGRE